MKLCIVAAPIHHQPHHEGQPITQETRHETQAEIGPVTKSADQRTNGQNQPWVQTSGWTGQSVCGSNALTAIPEGLCNAL